MRISATQARDQMSDILKKISTDQKGRVYIERYGNPVAVIVSPVELRKLDEIYQNYKALVKEGITLGEDNAPLSVYMLDWTDVVGLSRGISLHSSEQAALAFAESYRTKKEGDPFPIKGSPFLIQVPELIHSKLEDEDSVLRITEMQMSLYGFEREA